MNKPEDRWGKFLFRELFQHNAQVKTGLELLPDPIFVDILLIPTQPLPETLPGAGLFARYTGGRHCVVEPYSQAPDAMDLRTSLAKLQLALREAHRKQSAPLPIQGCLWILTRHWPEQALSQVFEQKGEELERGFLRWQGTEPIYLVNTAEIALRDDTILFRLMSKGPPRIEALRKIVKDKLQAYYGFINQFKLELKDMQQIEPTKPLSPEAWQEIKELLEDREQALIENAREEAIKQGKQEIARRMLQQGYELQAIQNLTDLSLEEIESLR